tara:strand:+ start:3423 stop:5345 length:1923 start_codon:yes stop_codon:yes gene_type:complete
VANESLKEQLALLKQLQEDQKNLNRLRDLSKRMDPSQIDKDALEQLVKSIEETSDKVQNLTKEIEKNKKAISDYNSALDKVGSTIAAVAPGMDKLTSAFKKNEEGIIDGKEAADSFISGMMSMAATIEETNVALAKQTGFATALQQDVIDLASSHDGLYLSMSESREVVGALSTGFKMYNAQSKQTRKEINDLAGRFKVLGVDTNAFASVLDQLNEGFGLTGTGALAAAAELENLAIRTGSPLASVVNDFQDLGPQMSRFGSDGVRVFTRLNEQARTLGLTTRQAFDLSELFDTFESSADVAGKLNAQLGLQLNSVELMAASSEDRLSILRAEFDMEGMRFDQMSRRQRQMVAEILQTDVLTAERLLGDPMELRKFQKEQENNAERVKAFTTAMDKFRAVSEQLFINLEPLLTGMMSLFSGIAEFFNDVMSSPIFGAIISFGGAALAVLIKLKGAATVLGTTLTSLGTKLAPVLSIVLAIKDILGAFGYGTGGDPKAQKSSAIKAIGGIVGGIAGFIAGGPVGAAIGYGLGRTAAATFIPVDDAISGPGGIAYAVRPSSSSAQAGPVVSQAGRPTMVGGPRDTVQVSRPGGALDEMGTKLDNLSKAVMELAKRPVQATMEMNGNKVGELVLNQMDPVATV